MEALILLIGLVVVSSMLMRAALDRTLLPPLVGFLLLGVALRFVDDRWSILDEQGEGAFELLGQLGVIALLFRVGLESDLLGLMRQLPRASAIWAGNTILSAVPGYLVVAHLLGYGVIPGLVAAIALTATSIGVSLGPWQQHGALKSPTGQLLTDVAEMDDLSGVVLMALVFAVLPLLAGSADGVSGAAAAGGLSIWSELLPTGALLLGKLIAFAGLCVLLGRYLERRLIATFERFEPAPELMVFVAGIGILISGLSAWLGFSAAIGALVAGLVFSRDPEAVKIDGGFRGIHELLTPFFFVGIGLSIDLDAVTSSSLAVGALVAVAIVGKVVGAGLPALATMGAVGAATVGISMVPRAEIAMVIISRGHELGEWVVPGELYAAFVIVSITTCIAAPVALEYMFRRWPPDLGA